MEKKYLEFKYFAAEKPRRYSNLSVNAEFELLKEERNRQTEQMDIIFHQFLEAVETHALNFFTSTIKKCFKEKGDDFNLISSSPFDKLLKTLFDNIQTIVRKHLSNRSFWAHKRHSVVEDPLPFEDYILFELPPVCIDKAIREILGYIAPPLIKNKVISVTSSDDWKLECRSNYILPTCEYNWSNEMTELFFNYKELYSQLKVIDEQLYSIKLFLDAA